jgi:hypothetical protein
MGHVAKRATPGANLSHDHEGGGAVAETLTQVGARSFFTYRMQVMLAQQVFNAHDIGAGGRFGANPLGLALGIDGGLDFDGDARDFFSATHGHAFFYGLFCGGCGFEFAHNFADLRKATIIP